MAKVASAAPAEDTAAADVQQQIEASVLRTAEMFALTKRSASSAYDYAPSKKVRVRTKLNDTYLLEFPDALLEPKIAVEAIDSTATPTEAATLAAPGPAPTPADVVMGGHPVPSAPGFSIAGEDSTTAEKPSFVDQVAKEAEEELALKKRKIAVSNINGDASSAVVEYKKLTETAAQFSSSAIARRRATQVPKPKWHAPWKLKRVIAGHLGWVRSISVDPTNDWFVTGSADRTIKVWDLASGQLKLTLTGHINAIRGLEVSPRHPYLFSAGEDKKVLCWDLEYNKVIRSYHGHLSGVFSLKVHPTLDILVSGGRDAVARDFTAPKRYNKGPILITVLLFEQLKDHAAGKLDDQKMNEPQERLSAPSQSLQRTRNFQCREHADRHQENGKEKRRRPAAETESRQTSPYQPFPVKKAAPPVEPPAAPVEKETKKEEKAEVTVAAAAEPVPETKQDEAEKAPESTSEPEMDAPAKPVTEEEKRAARAAKFGIPLSLDDKKAQRAKRFHLPSAVAEEENAKRLKRAERFQLETKDTLEKKKEARAERFGLNAEEKRRLDRAKRFGLETSEVFEEKRRKRMERFTTAPK
ncbi:hypothetical protein Pcac1_g2740 [Phytophthora cactorum]|nr:hypothetical protein Pcac1_g2740 [Phytophthora cactorum]